MGALLAVSLAGAGGAGIHVPQRGRRPGQLEHERDAICNSRASRLSSIIADESDLGLRTQIRSLVDQFVSHMCLGTYDPVNFNEADRCWVQTGNEECYRPVAVMLQPLYAARGWR